MKILIFAGAGISAESGLNTFRDKEGIWTKYKIDEVCNYYNFLKMKKDSSKRKYLFDFYNEIKNECNKAQPNESHLEIAKWQHIYGENNVKVVTANVDDLFEKAGVKNVLHVHGDLNHAHCTSCQNIWEETIFNHEKRCSACNSRQTKPNVVFFGEIAQNYILMNSIFKEKNRDKNDFIVAIGTSFNVIGAERIVHKKNSNTILINKEATHDDHWFNHHLIGNATENIHVAKSIIDKSLM